MVLRFIRLVVEAGVFFLQVARVGKNDAAEIDGWRRGVDRPAESLFHQAWNPAAVIEMGVGQNDRVDLLRRDGRVAPVALAPFLRTLKEPAIDKDLEAALARRVASVDQVLRTSHGSCSAEKLDIGQSFLPNPAEF